MIKFENVEVVGWEAAIRGMRNPMNSWSKTDSYPAVDCGKCGKIEREGICTKENRDCTGFECFVVGPNDLKLMTTLCNSGTDHRKFMRMLTVYVDITAPLYWWKEFDTYKVGTVANSCSTMHKIHMTPITEDLFSFDHVKLCDAEKAFLKELESLRCKYNETKDKKYWYALIQLLPESFNQKRTVMLNYEVLANIYKSRKNHKLDEWCWHEGIIDGDKTNKSYIGFCDWIETLPYSELITSNK